jgi:hypothetical protein
MDTGSSFQKQSKEHEANELAQFTFAATKCGHYMCCYNKQRFTV